MRSYVLAVAVTVAGCSGSGPVALEDFCARYAEILCDAAERCDCLSAAEAAYCPTFLAGECEDDVVTPVDSGRRGYDEVAAGECLDSFSSVVRDCSAEGDSLSDACDRMLVGLIPEGQGCEGDDECQPGLECHDSACTEMPGAGETCLQTLYCAEDLFCADDGRCEAPRGSGRPCPEGDEACGDDLYCDSVTSTCQPPLSVGESCAADSWACGEGLYCPETSQLCTKLPGAGGDCEPSSGECAAGLYCDATARCQPLKDAGEACGEDAECLSDECPDGTCAAGSTCEFFD